MVYNTLRVYRKKKKKKSPRGWQVPGKVLWNKKLARP